MRRINPDGPDADLAIELSPGQTEDRLSKQIQNNKQRAIVKYKREISRAKSRLLRTDNKGLKRRLKQKIKSLEGEIEKEQRFI